MNIRIIARFIAYIIFFSFQFSNLPSHVRFHFYSIQIPVPNRSLTSVMPSKLFLSARKLSVQSTDGTSRLPRLLLHHCNAFLFANETSETTPSRTSVLVSKCDCLLARTGWICMLHMYLHTYQSLRIKMLKGCEISRRETRLLYLDTQQITVGSRNKVTVARYYAAIAHYMPSAHTIKIVIRRYRQGDSLTVLNSSHSGENNVPPKTIAFCTCFIIFRISVHWPIAMERAGCLIGSVIFH